VLHVAPNPGSVAVGESAYQQIRADILSGRLLPRQKLRLEQLRADYDISINTLREILNRLTSENLVVSETARGFEVAPISSENLLEIAELRLLLESHAMEKSFRNGDLDWEARVVASHYKLAELGRRHSPDDPEGAGLLKRGDREFHAVLISACGSRALIESHGTMFDRYMRYLMLALIVRGTVTQQEHDLLLRHALDRDAPAAIAVLREHIEGCVAYTLERWRWS